MGTSKALLALTAAAAALPGYSGKAAAWAGSESDSGYRFSYYKEADVPAENRSGKDGQRYEVLSNQFHLLQPLGEEWDYAVDLTVETMSGASPWFIQPDANGKPIQVMSGATIEDNRVAVQGKLRSYRANGSQALSLGVSSEKDYLAFSGGVEASLDLNQARDTLSAGAGYSYDTLEPTDGGTARYSKRIASADKDSASAYAGWAHVLGRNTVAQLGVSFTYSGGYLSDPYKEAWRVDITDTVADRRPDRRSQFAVTGRLRQYFESLDAALHLDARYFADDWGIGSDTVEVAWLQRLPGGWRVTPSLRWYEQGRAEFYRPYYTAARKDGYYSSDYRLSAYGAVSGRLGLDKSWNGLSVSLAAEHYQSDGDYALKGVDDENPALVEFDVLSLALSYRWGAPAPMRSRRRDDASPAEVIPVTP